RAATAFSAAFSITCGVSPDLTLPHRTFADRRSFHGTLRPDSPLQARARAGDWILPSRTVQRLPIAFRHGEYGRERPVRRPRRHENAGSDDLHRGRAHSRRL